MIKHFESRYAAIKELEGLGFEQWKSWVWQKRPFTASIHIIERTEMVMVAISRKDGLPVLNYEMKL